MLSVEYINAYNSVVSKRENFFFYTRIHEAEKFQEKLDLCEIYLNVAVIFKPLSSTRTVMRVQPMGFWTRTRHGPQLQPICSLTENLGCKCRRDNSQSLSPVNFIGNHNKKQKGMGKHRGRSGVKKKPATVHGSEQSVLSRGAYSFSTEGINMNQILTNYKYYNKQCLVKWGNIAGFMR